jgi:hypothetical protein
MNEWTEFGPLTIGIMDKWNSGVMGLKENSALLNFRDSEYREQNHLLSLCELAAKDA